MAINDNDDYTLTGAQVKDLASRINAKEDSADLATVAETGSYNDLTDKPTIPAAQVNSDWNAQSGVAQILNKPTLATVATTGSYTDLSNKPTIPSSFSDLSGTVSTSQIADGAVTSAKLAGFSTANTTDTWVPVASNGNLQHRVIKAFNSDGSIPASAIADSAVTTAKINNSAVTTDKINNSAVTKAKMHGMPCPDYSNTITSWGTIDASSTKTVSADGFVIGKALVTGGDKQALISIGGNQVGGIPYNAGTQINNLQVAFCLPVKSGTAVTFTCSGGTGGYFQGCKLIGWQM